MTEFKQLDLFKETFTDIKPSHYAYMGGVNYYVTVAAPDWCVTIHPDQFAKVIATVGKYSDKLVDVVVMHPSEAING
jgi:hypothetical protein